MYYPGEFDRVVDVVVLGYGDAGAVAAITAHDAGADVLLVEKQRADDHRPNSRYAAGFIMVAHDIDSAARHLTGLYAVGGESPDHDLIRTWAVEIAANLDWLAAHGARVESTPIVGEHVGVAGYDSLRVYRVQPDPVPSGYIGCPLFGLLRSQVADRDIHVLHDATARLLLTDVDGGVIGVETVVGGSVLRVGARRGVVLAVGGYEASAELTNQYLPVNPAYFNGTRHNTGDGVRLALDVGAELWHMNVWPGHFLARFPETGYPGGVAIDMWGAGGFNRNDESPVPGGIIVDRDGRRFLAEPGPQHATALDLLAMDSVTLRRSRVPSWWIFDGSRLSRGPIVSTTFGPAGPLREFDWSQDNIGELDRGWIRGAGSVGDLARSIDCDPEVLRSTVERYNHACALGRDDEYGRDPATLTALEGPDFYAVALWPGASHTVGGPRRDAAARVQAARGGSIANLYSAGELGSLYGLLYPAGGASLAECLASGRIAGREAARHGAG